MFTFRALTPSNVMTSVAIPGLEKEDYITTEPSGRAVVSRKMILSPEAVVWEYLPSRSSEAENH